MSENASYRLANCSILSVSTVEAPEVVTSDHLDELLQPAYAATGMVPGQIERLAGVKTRRWFAKDEDYTDGAVEAGRRALADAGVHPSSIGVVINASVTRPHLEPGISSKVHHELGLPRNALAFDVTNACLGVVNSLQIAGTMIDSGQIDYALIVASEGSRQMQESSISRLVNGHATRQDVKDAFATMTLGSGAVGLVLGRSDRHGDAHRIVGGITRAGSEHHQLCIGGMDGMVTDSSRLFVEGLTLATDAFADAEAEWDWKNMDWYVAHQTSTVHIAGLCDTLHLPQEKFPISVDTYGNIGPVALPFTLGLAQSSFAKGDRVLLMGIGSGLNTSFTEVVW
ncbi:3-oxoacyl-ACP synthase III [Mobilicoccus caccae]|uniref:3-oxoacyl-ACP synthase III n=1 Tax=Mobilicoccus caccae TaxID=1859295 RepID=A0ABQ6IWF1_9MICO|nr:3-oxoacyl-ACP synthase III [Mobilicoccus caccae]GMA42275.1 3-oxoacyl-ACP synthase III [Mobilicoccus caccae]